MGLIDSVLIKNKSARWLFLGQLLSQIFDRVTSLGLIWYLTQKFSVSSTSWFLVFGGLPHLLFSLNSGRWIQRLGILRTLVLTDFFRSGLYLVAALVTSTGTDFESIGFFFAIAFLSNVAASLFNPAVMTVPLTLAEGKEVQSLTALLTSCGSFSVVLGPLIAVLLSQKIGLSGVFLVTGIAYAVAGGASAMVRRQTRTQDVSAPPSDSDDGVGLSSYQIVRQYRVLGFMLGSFLAMNLLLGPLQIIFPVFSKDVYGRAFDGMAWLESSLGVGMILGGLLLTMIQIPWTVIRSITVSLILASLCYLIFTASSDFVTGRWALGAFGFFLSCANVMIINLFQSEPAEKDVPSVMALANMIGVASVPLSLAATSYFVQVISVPALAMTTAGALVAVSLTTGVWLNRRIPAEVRA
jgi:MFS family permease